MRLNFGCGEVVADGWANVDRRPSSPAVTYVDPARMSLPFEDGAFDYAVAHHVLDMCEDAELQLVLVELRRVIAPGGLLRISTFDMLTALAAWRRDDLEWFDFIAKGATITDKLGYALTYYGTRRWLFTPDSLTSELLAAGFPVVHEYLNPSWTGYEADPSIRDLDGRFDESFFLEAHVREG